MKKVRVNLDSRNRIPLTRLLGSSACNAKTFQAYWSNDNKIVLEPMVEIPERELWVYKNKDVLAALERGLQDSANGKIKRLKKKDLADE